MKNLKKLLAVIITLAIMATMMVPAFAAEEISEDAQIVSELELLVGDGEEGVTSEYLAKNTVRIQAAIIFLKLVGKLDEATAFDGEETFEDADQVKWAEGKNILAYLKANPDLGWVGDAGNFKPQDPANAQEIYKVILEVLGFKAKVADSEDFDFEWKDVFTFAADNGLEKIADVKKLTNDDLATAIVEGLLATTTDGVTLVEKLVELEVIDEDLAIELGLIEDELVATAAASGAKALTVKFNKAVDTAKATFSVKRTSIIANVSEVAWNEAKTEATLTMANYLTKGTYTITVKGLEEELVATVDVEDQKVANVEFTSDTAVLDRVDSKIVTLGYKVTNQYGEDVSSETVIPTSGKGTAVAASGVITITAGSDFVIGEKVPVSIVHVSSQTFVSAVFTVGAKAQVADIAITSLVNDNKKELVAGTSEDFYLVVEAKDQYGNVMTNATNVNSDIMITVSNPAVADVARTDTTPAMSYSDSKLKLALIKAGDPAKFTAGESTVMLISKTTGRKATFVISVKDSTKIDTLTLVAPDVVAAGDKGVEIGYTAVDQFGNALTSGLTGHTFNVPSGFDLSFVYDKKADKDKLILNDNRTNPPAGTVVFSTLTGTNKFVTLTINFREKAVPTVIAGTKDFDKVYAVDGTATMEVANVIVHDQYGRVMDTLPTGYTVVAATSDATKVSITGAVADGAVFKGVAKGNSTITLKLNNGSDIANSAYTFTAKTIEVADVASFAFNAIPLLKVDATAATEVSVVGKDEAGNNVALKAGTITLLTTDSALFTVDSDNMEIKAITDAGTANISAWIGAKKVATIAVTSSKADAVATTVKFAEASYEISGAVNATKSDLQTALEVKDQYGNDYDVISGSKGAWITSDSSIATVANGVLTLKKAGTVKISYISSNGIIAEVEVDVTITGA